MIFRYTFLAKSDVALRANKSGILSLLVNFKIQGSAIVGRGQLTVTMRSAPLASSSAARAIVRRSRVDDAWRPAVRMLA